MGWGGELQDFILKGNGSMDFDYLHGFGYAFLHELTLIGQGLSQNFYNSSKLYSYYQGCSEGGREGWSQVQRYGNLFDGAAIGAPAFRQSFQQPNHDWPQIYETSVLDGYAPNTCALTKIKNLTVDACDSLDGKVDGVVARSDLCKLQFNANSTIGQSYSCAASSSSNPITGAVSSTNPAVNGTINEKDVAVFLAVQNGPYDSSNRHLYVGFQPGTDTSSNAAGTYNSNTSSYEVAAISGIGAEWIQYLLNEVIDESLSLDGVDVERLRAWMIQGQQEYAGTMNTVWTDLSQLQEAGGKVVHYHGEADNSIPTLSSVIYWEQVRRVMFPNATFEESVQQLSDFYRLYIVPGAAHCSPSAENGPFPQTVLGSVIEWVENGVVPTQLNATVLQGAEEGKEEKICSFPYRPMWQNNSTDHTCVMPDQDALDTWFPVLDSTPINPYGDA
ncbi:Tannase [Pseudocercospora fuligena]|uniref:Carboxylic ester hydrolase n=1 Tax=Pseudocercospora fuligena TaxID=685502 RepID=A0A8H6R991_9PEZI|nr:Tannase [Pseudocercospora fuligena]